MRTFWTVVLLLLPGLHWTLTAQDEALLKAAMYLSGASSPEEVDPSWIERLESARTIRVNARHLRPGILSDYQIAALADYRSTSGDILSWEELALVDGFGREAVDALRPFLSLESARLPGATDTIRTRAMLLSRITLNSFGIKGKAYGENWQLAGAWRGKDWTAHAQWEGRQGRVVAGDFNLRYGEGLALWSGFSMNSLSTVDAFIQRATGISPVWSYTSGNVHRGLSYEWSGRHIRASAFATLGKLLGAYADYLWHSGRVGATLAWQGGPVVSVDGRWSSRGVDISAEAAYRNAGFAAKVSARGKAGERWKLAAQARVIPSRFSGKKNGEYALGAGAGFAAGAFKASLTADASLLPIPREDPRRFQLRARATATWQASPAFALDLRFTERYRNYEHPRSELRSDLRFSFGPWLSVLRAHVAHCESWGFLIYLEGGYKAGNLSAYLRLTGFSARNWADRIYCYERDAPGTFSVPAYSGQGLQASFVAGYKLRLGRRLSLKANLRAAWMARVGREPTPTLNFQLQFGW